MNYLLDTRVFLWMAAEPEKLAVKAEACVMNTNNTFEPVTEIQICTPQDIKLS